MPGGRIDADRAFRPLRLAILTITDSRDASNDSSGDLLAERAAAAGHAVHARALVRHDKGLIQSQARVWIDDPRVDVIVTNGGTGLGARDVAPEALRELFDRELEGFYRAVAPHFLRDRRGVDHAVARLCGNRGATPSSTCCPVRTAPAGMGGTN